MIQPFSKKERKLRKFKKQEKKERKKEKERKKGGKEIRKIIWPTLPVNIKLYSKTALKRDRM